MFRLVLTYAIARGILKGLRKPKRFVGTVADFDHILKQAFSRERITPILDQEPVLLFTPPDERDIHTWSSNSMILPVKRSGA